MSEHCGILCTEVLWTVLPCSPTGRLPTFQRNMLPPSSGVINQKTTIYTFTPVKTSNLVVFWNTSPSLNRAQMFSTKHFPSQKQQPSRIWNAPTDPLPWPDGVFEFPRETVTALRFFKSHLSQNNTSFPLPSEPANKYSTANRESGWLQKQNKGIERHVMSATWSPDADMKLRWAFCVAVTLRR
jgi:hypothetical protein